MPRSGADLAHLLLAGFRSLTDQATAELAARGYEDVTVAHEFALQAILAGADSASDLGRRLEVTKQAAAKTIAALEARGYVMRQPDPADRRRMQIRVTERGTAMLAEGAEIFEQLRRRWEATLGAERLAALEQSLAQAVGDDVIRLDAPGAIASVVDAG